MSRTTSTAADPGDQSSETIEREVERIRAGIGDTFEELRGRMAPGRMLDELVGYAHRAGGGDLVRGVARSTRENPLPLMLIGIGVAWLAVYGFGRTGGPGRGAAGTGSRPPPPPGVRGTSRVRVFPAADDAGRNSGAAARAVDRAEHGKRRRGDLPTWFAAAAAATWRFGCHGWAWFRSSWRGATRGPRRWPIRSRPAGRVNEPHRASLSSARRRRYAELAVCGCARCALARRRTRHTVADCCTAGRTPHTLNSVELPGSRGFSGSSTCRSAANARTLAEARKTGVDDENLGPVG